jgi:type I restriction-modification system DNA methylase subunit
LRSKERARELGEVFTPDYLVKDILSHIPDSSSTTKYFEPGCGSGNFLIQILERKLQLILESMKRATTGNNPEAWMRECFFALSSLYGIDIDSDNVSESRQRLRDRLLEEANQISASIRSNSAFWNAIDFLLAKNIITGDLLNSPQTIEIAEYAELPDDQVKIRYFWFSELIHPDDEVFQDSAKLFDHVPESHRADRVMSYLEVSL